MTRNHDSSLLESAPDQKARTPSRQGQLASLGVPTRRPPHPGHFLATRFMKPRGISQTELAAALGVSRRRVNELINGRRAITPDSAVRLGMYFGNEASFWMHLQVAWDMHSALRDVRASRQR